MGWISSSKLMPDMTRMLWEDSQSVASRTVTTYSPEPRLVNVGSSWNGPPSTLYAYGASPPTGVMEIVPAADPHPASLLESVRFTPSLLITFCETLPWHPFPSRTTIVYVPDESASKCGSDANGPLLMLYSYVPVPPVAATAMKPLLSPHSASPTSVTCPTGSTTDQSTGGLMLSEVQPALTSSMTINFLFNRGFIIGANILVSDIFLLLF